MRVVYGRDAIVAEWVAAHIPHMDSGEDFGPCAALGVVDALGQLIGGVVYNSWYPKYRTIEISGASERANWLTKGVAREILAYPFVQLNVGRITALTPRSARPARRFLDKFGFRREGLVRHGYGKEDLVVMGLLRKEWDALPWGGALNGEKVPHAARAA